MSERTIQPLSPGDTGGLDQVYAIYRDAIVKSEQRTEAEFRSLIARPDYRLLVARRDEEIMGFAVSFVPAHDDFWLFEYAAVTPEARGAGVGAQLFLASRLIAGNARIALVEVDADDGSDEQARRLAFYSRLGCRRLGGLGYLLPLDAFGDPPPMVLLALAPFAVTHINVDTVERWLRRIYAEVYGKLLDDPRLAAMIDPLEDDLSLDLI